MPSSKDTLTVPRESEKRHGEHARTTCRQAIAVCQSDHIEGAQRYLSDPKAACGGPLRYNRNSLS